MRATVALILLLFVSACGFHLRNAYTVPFKRIYIALPEQSALHALLARSISAGAHVQISEDAESADAVFRLVGDTQYKDILSIGADGRVREFQLVRTFSFAVDDKQGHRLVSPSPITLRRDVTFSDASVLSKEAEEALLWRDIENDLVQQILRRLATAKMALE